MFGFARGRCRQAADGIVGVAHGAIGAALCQQAAQGVTREVGAYARAFGGDEVARVGVDVVRDLAVEARLASQAAFGVVAEQVRLVVAVDEFRQAQRVVVAVAQRLFLGVDAFDQQAMAVVAVARVLAFRVRVREQVAVGVVVEMFLLTTSPSSNQLLLPITGQFSFVSSTLPRDYIRPPRLRFLLLLDRVE